MSPYLNGNEPPAVSEDLVKSKLEKPPVADNHMYDFKYNHALPTSDLLGLEIPANCDAHKEAQAIVDQLAEVMGKGDARGFANMFLEYGKLCSTDSCKKWWKGTHMKHRCLAR
jgi:hypothetical protein